MHRTYSPTLKIFWSATLFPQKGQKKNSLFLHAFLQTGWRNDDGDGDDTSGHGDISDDNHPF